MAAINAASLNALRTMVRTEFQGVQQNVTPLYMAIASVVPSNSKSNTYNWLGSMPEFREWVGDRVINNIKEHGYSVVNKTFENTVGIKREDVEDDTVGTYRPMVQSLAQKGMEFPDKLVFNLLKAGFTTECYDGQNFFDKEHPVYANNDGTGAVTQVANMHEDVGFTGKPWFLLDTSQPIKPIIFQERRALAVNTLFSPTDPAAWTKNEFQFGADCRCNAGFGFWQMAYAVKGALNAENLWKAYTAMTNVPRDGGETLEINPVVLVVPTEHERAALKLMKREFIDEGGTTVTNELMDKFEVLVAKKL